MSGWKCTAGRSDRMGIGWLVGDICFSLKNTSSFSSSHFCGLDMTGALSVKQPVTLMVVLK